MFERVSINAQVGELGWVFDQRVKEVVFNKIKMVASELISDEIPPLKTSDTGLKALSWMDEFRVSHLPVVNNTEYLGLISDADILDLNSPDEPLSNYKVAILKPSVKSTDHVFYILKLMSQMKLSVLPVLDESESYLGLITQNKLIQALSTMSSISDPGGIIILELNLNDFHLSEVAQIAESNNTKILSCFITSLPDSTKLDLTLKFNKQDISAVLQTFYRYNYTVKGVFNQTDFTEDYHDRYNSLMNYINM